MDRTDIRRAIDRPREERRRIRLGDVERLHPKPANVHLWSTRVGPIGTVAIGAALGVLAALVLGARRR